MCILPQAARSRLSPRVPEEKLTQIHAATQVLPGVRKTDYPARCHKNGIGEWKDSSGMLQKTVEKPRPMRSSWRMSSVGL